MAARKRKSIESLDRYHENLKREETQMQDKLRGRLLWPRHYRTARKVVINGKLCLTNGSKSVVLSN